MEKDITFGKFMKKYGKRHNQDRYFVSGVHCKTKEDIQKVVQIKNPQKLKHAIRFISEIFGYKSPCDLAIGVNSSEYVEDDLYVGEYDKLLWRNELSFLGVFFV